MLVDIVILEKKWLKYVGLLIHEAKEPSFPTPKLHFSKKTLWMVMMILMAVVV